MIKTNIKQEIDPRAKLMAALVLSTLAILIQDMVFLLVLFLYTFFFLVLFKVNVLDILPRIKRFVPLFIGLLVIQSIFSPSGQALISLANMNIITYGGIEKGITVVLRLFVVIASAMILTTSPADKIILGLVKLKVPYEIAFMVLLAVRFLPVLADEFIDVMTAIQLRGVDIKKIPPGQKLRVYAYILMPVVAGAVMRAKKTAVAMEARAFRAYPKRTYINDLDITLRDYLIIIFFLIFGIAFYLYYIARG